MVSFGLKQTNHKLNKFGKITATPIDNIFIKSNVPYERRINKNSLAGHFEQKSHFEGNNATRYEA